MSDGERDRETEREERERREREKERERERKKERDEREKEREREREREERKRSRENMYKRGGNIIKPLIESCSHHPQTLPLPERKKPRNYSSFYFAVIRPVSPLPESLPHKQW